MFISLAFALPAAPPFLGGALIVLGMLVIITLLGCITAIGSNFHPKRRHRHQQMQRHAQHHHRHGDYGR